MPETLAVYIPGVYTDDMENETHTGPVIIRYLDWGIHVLCCAGHSVTARMNKDLRGGSGFMADVVAWQSNPDSWVVTCDGALAA